MKKAISIFRQNECSKIYHVGDLIGIGPYPKEVFELALSIEELTLIMGNPAMEPPTNRREEQNECSKMEICRVIISRKSKD